MNKIWYAIANEAELGAEHIAFGTTILRHADFSRKAYYYQAFFSLSVGFERTAKLALAIGSALDKGSFPPNKELRAYGHDLTTLLESVDRLAYSRHFSHRHARLPRSDIHNAIISVLSDFASNVSRYYNLDLITGARRIDDIRDPVAAWYQDVFLRVVECHYSQRQSQKDEAKMRAMAQLLDDVAFVLHSREDGQPLTSVFELSMLAEITRRTNPFLRMYVLQVARFIGAVFMELTDLAYAQGREDIPDLTSIFAIFNNDDEYFRQRATWSIYRM
jgi:hypothetical protein